MSKRSTCKSPKTIQVFIVSWFGVGADEAASLMCLSRDQANRTVETLKRDFAAFPRHDPLIHVDREERRALA